MLECRAVNTRVGSFELRDVSLMVPTGGHAVITGPTASGKTTLLEVIAGATMPISGRVVAGDVDVTFASPESRGIGLVLQHGYLFPHLNARRNMEYGAVENGIVDDLARRFGVSHLMERSVSSLSGGERQLVALCRALAARPSVLLLDEPFSALDATRRTAALSEFASLQTGWALTVLHVTHQDSDAMLATQRFEMNDGALHAASTAT